MNKPSLSWSRLFLLTFLAAYLYIFNEWLFAITKPSYINNLGFTVQFQILLTSGALLASLCILGLLPLIILNFFPSLRWCKIKLIQLGAWLPAVIFASMILLLVDNFTYTLFKFGIVSTEGWSRGVYCVGFILVIMLCYRSILKAVVSLNKQAKNWRYIPTLSVSLLTVALLLAVIVLVLPQRTRKTSEHMISNDHLPHILLVTADGLDVSHMSVYGYVRNTTPNLRNLAESALLAENAFSNSANTAGSIISMYTGKYPTKTRVLYKPDILRGDDAYEHLPGILQSHGYKTVQITLPYYLDANELNIADGFDEVTTNSIGQSKYLNKISKILPGEHAFFIDASIKRIADRIRHIFFVKKMINPYTLVTGTPGELVDLERLESVKYVIQSTLKPVFIHVHFMGTHGGTFNPIKRNFSAGHSVEDQEAWNDDFYDDSILDFDNNIGNLLDFLTNQGLLEKTLIIIGSDHGQQWNQLKRLPLLIRFPYRQYAGRYQVNVQNLDIPVTILDFLNLEKPDWMRGNSLIGSTLEQRPIFGIKTVKNEKQISGVFAVNQETLKPPFFQFAGITMVYCQKWYELDLFDKSWKSGYVEGSTSVCQPGTEITDELAFQWIVEHLKENNFDVSTLDYFPK